MRSPTPESQSLAWWTRALEYHERNGSMRGCDAAGVRITDEPQPGFYRRRLVRNGPWVAARIWLEAETDEDGSLASDEVLKCEVGGKARDPADQWTYLASHPIPREEYDYMMDNQRWCEQNDPNDPVSQPERPIDFNKLPTPF